MKNTYLLAILLCLGDFLQPAPTYAECGCEPHALMIEGKTGSSYVMLVDILEKTRVLIPNIEKNYSEFLLKIRVNRVWKGDAKRFMYIHVPENKDDCGIELKLGESYLIYAVGGKVPMVTSCSRTKKADSSQAKIDMRALGSDYKIPY